MISLIVGSTSSAPSTSAVNYNSVNPAGTGSWGTGESGRGEVIPHAMTLDNLMVTLTTTPGATGSYAFEIMKNGVASGVSVTIANPATTGTSATSISVAAGDYISMRCTPTGTPAATGIVYWSIRMDASTGYAVMGVNVGLPSAAATNYQAPLARTLISATEATISQIVPVAGTFNNLYLRAGSAYTGAHAYTLFKNGVAQSLTATLTNPAGGGGASDTTNSVAVVAGDLVSLRIVTTGTPVSTPVSHAMKFTPTTDGYSFLSSSQINSNSASAANYNQILGADTTWNATENQRFSITQAMTITGMYGSIGVAPGAGKSVAHTYRNAGVSSAATLSYVTNTTANITGLSISVASGASSGILSTPTGTPTATTLKSGLQVYFAPSVVTASSSTMLMMGM